MNTYGFWRLLWRGLYKPTMPAGRMMMQVAGSFAEFERAMLRDRTIIALDTDRREGHVYASSASSIASSIKSASIIQAFAAEHAVNT